MSKKILSQFNIVSQCRKYGLSLWQCPQFLFLLMGLIIIVSSILSYMIGSRYIDDPGTVALVVIIITAVLFTIASIITRSFENLAELSRMKSEFINVVSHQIRSPLTNLKWALDFLTSNDWKKTPEKEEEYRSVLYENINRMSELVDDLLVVSRLEQGTVPLRKKEVSLEKMVEGLLSEFKSFAAACNLKIEFSHQAGLPLVFVDPSQMKIVFENLIDNAIRYTKGGGKIRLHLEKKDKNIYFEIKDSGVGIPKEDQKYIFQKFFRSENMMREQTKGSGLGLFITKAIVEEMGGKIGFISEEGKGTTFFFNLPIK